MHNNIYNNTKTEKAFATKIFPKISYSKF